MVGCTGGRGGGHEVLNDAGQPIPTNTDGSTSPGPPVPPNCVQTNPPMNGDQDNDGYTPAQGDCNDCNPLINPGAVQIAGDTTDYACNGMPGVVATCPTVANAATDPMSMAQAMDLCDSRFLLSAATNGPSDTKARRVEQAFGVVMPRANASMSLISNGIAASETDTGYSTSDAQDPGNELGGFLLTNNYANPLPDLPSASQCPSATQPSTVYDYTELVLTLKAPTNAKTFSFDSQFFSAEYSTFVCMGFNDEFLVIQKSDAFPTPSNIAFDSMHNAITVNSGFFTVCQNDPMVAQADHCTSPVSGINGTGFEMAGGLSDGVPGGSTGWLTTTSPVTPGETFTLRFIIFDEGDDELNSDALIDNFRWGTTATTAPMTMPIQ
jgi:hypothetical protein